MSISFKKFFMTYTLEDLSLAYRKAKVDLYYSSHAPLFAIADYEDQLQERLQSLLDRINGDDEDWINDTGFLGDWFPAAKSIDCLKCKCFSASNGEAPIFSSPEDKWRYVCESIQTCDQCGKRNAEFRLMAQCSIDFHVMSTLWMLEVGHKYDVHLSDSAYGNRLRRTQDKNEINRLSMGSFKPYLKPFREWRDNGIAAMRGALENEKKVVALTADVTSFYHKLNPGFMLDDAFNQLFALDLSPKEDKLHRLFIKTLQAWAEKTPLKKGLPVGLPAAALVANMALYELDRLIEQQIAPLYYGRYVDDILLVMENGVKFNSATEVWDWIFSRSNGMLGWNESDEPRQIQFQPEYFTKSKCHSQICFSTEKTKVFLLSGGSGKTLVDAIARQIHKRASEWRAMPNLPNSPAHIATDLVAATQSDGEVVDNLRKTDVLAMRRADFAIKLRDFEAYERDLRPEAWRAHRHAFFSAFIQHVLVLPSFFELAIYLPRVIRLATACEDFEYLRKIINRLNSLSESVRQDCNPGIKSCPDDPSLDSEKLVERWKIKLLATVSESIIAAFPPRLSKEGNIAWQTHMTESDLEIDTLSIKELQKRHEKLFSHDLAHMPFRFIGLPKEMVSQRGIPYKKSVTCLEDAAQIMGSEIVDGISTLSRWLRFKNDLPFGLLFATRPFQLSELFLLTKDPFSKTTHQSMQKVVLALRGFKSNDKMPSIDKKGVLQVPNGDPQAKYAIAVSCWKTRHDSWVASVMRSPDPDLGRYERILQLVNSVISQPKGARYLILPELSLPAHWFIRIAHKLQGRGISLISGVEYLHARQKRVRNQVWAALTHDGLGFPSMMIYRQDKQRPALHEERELQRLAGVEMKPDKTWKTPPIVQHGDFRFALLVCSELSNIGYRAALRGNIDALFVPEWNQDTQTFTALVESAALDIHAYIIQCNDRQYGDSRIRAPFKESWRRDVLRVKGGITDYCVTGKIDVQALRRFQSSHRSANGPFKPVPDGFVINHNRKMLPAGTSGET